jgi:hypothetical protein
MIADVSDRTDVDGAHEALGTDRACHAWFQARRCAQFVPNKTKRPVTERYRT